MNQIYDQLPQFFSEFHHEGDASDPLDTYYLTQYWSDKFNDWETVLNGILNFDGNYDFFNDEQLDYFAPFFGFTGEWYDTNWKKQTKIKLFKGVYKEPWIWRFRGSYAVFNYVCDAFGVKGEITAQTGFIVGKNKTGDIIGSGDTAGMITVIYPGNYFDDSAERGYLQFIVEKFIPLHIQVRIKAQQI